MKIITGFTVVNDAMGVKIAYVYNSMDEDGNIKETNQTGSYIVTKQELTDSINAIKEDIQSRL